MVQALGTAKIQEMNPKHIVFFQSAYLGDVILALPTLHEIKNKLKEVHITYICLNKWTELLKNYDFIDTVIGIEKKQTRHPWLWSSIWKQLPFEADLLITAHRSVGSQLFNLCGPIQKKIGFSTTFLKSLFSATVPYDTQKPELYRVADFLQYFHIRPLQKPFTTKLPVKTNSTWLESLRINKPYVILAPGSQWNTKRWPLTQFMALADKMRSQGWHIVWTGLSREIVDASHLNHLANDTNLIDRTDLSQWLSVISRASLVICNDSAAAHACTIHQVPVVTIFGSTIPQFGYAPQNIKSVVVEKQISCRPCTNHGRHACPKQHFKCMNTLSPNEVFDQVGSLQI